MNSNSESDRGPASRQNERSSHPSASGGGGCPASSPPEPTPAEALAEVFRQHLERFSAASRMKVPPRSTTGYLKACRLFDLAEGIRALTGELAARALEEPDAAELLYTTTTDACRDFWEVCERQPKRMSAIAARKMLFPCNWPVLRKEQAQVLATVERLSVGKAAMFEAKGRKQFDPEKIANRVAIELVQRIVSAQADFKAAIAARSAAADAAGVRIPPVAESVNRLLKLDRPSKANSRQWAAAVWDIVLRETGGTPELDERLQSLGLHRKNHSLHLGQQTTVTARTEAANIRDGIRDRITRAVVSLAADPSRSRSGRRRE